MARKNLEILHFVVNVIFLGWSSSYSDEKTRGHPHNNQQKRPCVRLRLVVSQLHSAIHRCNVKEHVIGHWVGL